MAALAARAADIEKALKAAGVRLTVDRRDNYTPGWKYNYWELRVGGWAAGWLAGRRGWARALSLCEKVVRDSRGVPPFTLTSPASHLPSSSCLPPTSFPALLPMGGAVQPAFSSRHASLPVYLLHQPLPPCLPASSSPPPPRRVCRCASSWVPKTWTRVWPCWRGETQAPSSPCPGTSWRRRCQRCWSRYRWGAGCVWGRNAVLLAVCSVPFLLVVCRD